MWISFQASRSEGLFYPIHDISTPSPRRRSNPHRFGELLVIIGKPYIAIIRIPGKSSGIQRAHGRVVVLGGRQPACVLRPARFVLPSFFAMNSEACYKNRVQASLHGAGCGVSSYWPHKKSGHAQACPDFSAPADRRGHSNHPCTHFDTSIITGPRKKPVINVVSPTVEPSRNPADSMEISQIIRTAR